MDWSAYYEHFYDWAESTQVSRISSIDEFGDVGGEVAEIVQNLIDEKAASRLVRRALAHGVRFTANEIDDMLFYLDTIPDGLLLTCKTVFTKEQIENIACCYANHNVLDEIARKSGIDPDADMQVDILNTNAENCEPPRSSFGKMLGAIGAGFIDGFFGSKNKKQTDKCNGDCANCPPHYGYRYGRWYYGHGHNSGCEFGGNRGGGND